MAERVKAVVENKRDTAANLTSDDLTFLNGEIVIESDTLRIKIGDGSTAWTSLPYANRGLPLSFDISSSNTVIALDPINGVVQSQRYYWTGGDGSHTFSFTVSDGSTIGGLAATTWIGKMNGFIDIESDGTSDWKVIEFRDFPEADNSVQDQMSKCKAWVNFDGTGVVAINDSFNVTSITDNGVGDYTINFTNNLPNANYSSVGMASAGALVGENNAGGSKTVSSYRISVSVASSAAQFDSSVVSVHFFST